MPKELELNQIISVGNRKNLKVIQKIEVEKGKFDHILKSIENPEKKYRYYWSGVITRNY